MPDPTNQVEQIIQRGLAWAMPKMARSVALNGQSYVGVRTELTVDAGEVQYGGKRAKRAFSMLIIRGTGTGQLAADPIEGARVVDDLGRAFTLVEVKSDAAQITLVCAGNWG